MSARNAGRHRPRHRHGHPRHHPHPHPRDEGARGVRIIAALTRTGEPEFAGDLGVNVETLVAKGAGWEISEKSWISNEKKKKWGFTCRERWDGRIDILHREYNWDKMCIELSFAFWNFHLHYCHYRHFPNLALLILVRLYRKVTFYDYCYSHRWYHSFFSYFHHGFFFCLIFHQP
jgi:hypothetical protein